jgi:hypothetical protein
MKKHPNKDIRDAIDYAIHADGGKSKQANLAMRFVA